MAVVVSEKWKKGEVKRTFVVKSNEIIFIFKTHDRKRKGENNRWPLPTVFSGKRKRSSQSSFLCPQCRVKTN
jgi:hypothetical protein